MKVSQYISQSTLSISSQATLLVSNFIVFLLLVKTSPIEQFSSWAMFVTIVSIVDTIRQGFLHHAFIRSYLNPNCDQQATVRNFAWVNYGFVTFFSIIISVFSNHIEAFFELPGLRDLLINYVFMAFGLASLQFLNTWFVAQKAFFNQLVFSVLFTVTLLSYLFVLWMTSSLTPLNYIYGQFGIGLVIFFYIAIRSNVLKSTPSYKWFREVLAYGQYTSGTSLLSLIFHKSDILLIGYFLDPFSVSIFHFASKIVNYCEIPLNGFSQVLFPKFSTCSKQNLWKLYLLSGFGITLFMTPIVTITFLNADYIILILGNNEYMAATDVLYYLLMASLIKPWGRVFGITLDAIGKPHINFQMLLMSVIINISLNLILIPLYGIEGAAIATLSSICITIAIGQIRLSQYIDWQFNEIKLYLKLYLTQLLNILKSNYYGNFIRK
jgi:O-antigen/teichoic acid export membrane protein